MCLGWMCLKWFSGVLKCLYATLSLRVRVSERERQRENLVRVRRSLYTSPPPLHLCPTGILMLSSGPAVPFPQKTSHIPPLGIISAAPVPSREAYKMGSRMSTNSTTGIAPASPTGEASVFTAKTPEDIASRHSGSGILSRPSSRPASGSNFLGRS